MTSTEIRLLWLYAAEMWGTTFKIPETVEGRSVKARVWTDILGDLDAGLVRRTLASSSAHFAPTPGEIRAAALALGRRERGEAEPKSADEALVELRRLVSRHGWPAAAEARAEAADWSPALAAVIDAMGWADICADEHPGVFRGQFLRLWEGAVGRLGRSNEMAPALISRLAGVIEVGP